MDFFKKYKYGFRILLVGLIFLFGKNGIAQTSITGKIINEETKEELIGAEIILYKNGNLLRNTRTDSKGNYKLNIDPGTYEIDFFCRGFTSQRIVGIIGVEGQLTKLNLQLSNKHGCDFVTQMRTPLVKIEKMEKGQVFVDDTFFAKPNREINEIITITSGLSLTQ